MSHILFNKSTTLFRLLSIFVVLSACTATPTADANTTSPAAAETVMAQRSVQFTQTALAAQSPTPMPLPTLLLTIDLSNPSSLPTVTQDATLASLPTISFNKTPINNTLIPFPTNTLSVPTLGPGTPETECFISASKGGIQLRLGPSFSAYRLLPEMEPGVIYQAIDIHEQYYQLALDGVPVGWVQYIDVFPTEGLSDLEGPGCDRLLARPRSHPLTEFPGLCLYTAISPTETFQDSALTEPFFISISPSSGPFVGMTKTRKSIFTLLSHAGPSFHAPLDKVSTSAACDGIPAPATVTTPGWLWSKPDEATGEKLLQLTAGMHLHIEGNRPPDGSGKSAWVQAVFEQQNESISGWVWSALLSFD